MLENPGPKGIREAWDHTYSLNVTSTEVFTQTFAPLLLNSAQPRLLFLTSLQSSLEICSTGTKSAFAKPSQAGWPKPAGMTVIAYRASKAALNMLMLEWSNTLKPDGVKVFGISPGMLATSLGGLGKEKMEAMGAGDASLGGFFIKEVVEGRRDEDSGKALRRTGLQPW